MLITFKAYGHENIRATHNRTIEFTKHKELSVRGDCIIGVNSDFSFGQNISKNSLNIISIIKSVVFAWLIIWIGAYFGFKVRGGAEDVGKKTTASVVFGIFAVWFCASETAGSTSSTSPNT